MQSDAYIFNSPADVNCNIPLLKAVFKRFVTEFLPSVLTLC